MPAQALSIRPFVGAKDFAVSRSFYRAFGFTEVVLSAGMSYFVLRGVGFYLQDAYVQDWIGNTMLFLEVADVEQYWAELTALDLPSKYEGVRILPIRQEAWGKEGFLFDPSGILWHIGEFNKE
ncbi:glyoxalase [Hymenobacter aquaticus]|uniref:Glyoxalase n=1 Tax=Hymenobacter aquaticus TaxID=1867101 RepID=A0A4Z0Q989_9BACT|nr:glyoxalase [Hymenobacter aquaticus]TGE25282.1 glyoxalase [Hymenobacter aquaticus]